MGDTKKVLCKYFAQGVCKKGDSCAFSHTRGDRPNMVCVFYQRGVCSYGSNCRYDHVKPGKHKTNPTPPRQLPSSSGTSSHYKVSPAPAQAYPDASHTQSVDQSRPEVSASRFLPERQEPVSSSSDLNQALQNLSLATGRENGTPQPTSSSHPNTLEPDPLWNHQSSAGYQNAGSAATWWTGQEYRYYTPQSYPYSEYAYADASFSSITGDMEPSESPEVPWEVYEDYASQEDDYSAAPELHQNGSTRGQTTAGSDYLSAGAGPSKGTTVACTPGVQSMAELFKVPGSNQDTPARAGEQLHDEAVVHAGNKAAHTKDTPLCSMASAGSCPYGASCPRVHGNICPHCKKSCLHPLRPEETAEHLEVCQRNKKKLEALRKSQEIECSVCLERVLSKLKPSERKFGILSHCDHPHCIACIRGWRRTANQGEPTGLDLDNAIRACPVCRVQSHFVTPSVVWYFSLEEKEQIIEGYKRKLSAIDCRHFNFGDGNCPFGTSCFYRHAHRDGRLEEVRLRHLGSADGSTVIAKEIRLSDFITMASTRGRR